MSLPIGKHRLLTYALIAHELNNFQSSHFVQLFNFKEDLPIVDVPTEKEYYRRKLIKEYKTLKGDRTQELNRLHALFVQCGITTIKRSNLQTEINRQISVDRPNLSVDDVFQRILWKISSISPIAFNCPAFRYCSGRTGIPNAPDSTTSLYLKAKA